MTQGFTEFVEGTGTMINSPLDISRVQATLDQTSRQRHSLFARIDVFIVVTVTVLLLFWLARRPWGLALEIFIAAWIALSIVSTDWIALGPAVVIGLLAWFVAAQIRSVVRP
jgi:hypothetical protein